MGKGIRAFFWILTAFLFAYDLYLWGGLATTPGVGKQLREMASVQSPLATTYLFVGRHAVTASGQADNARAFVAERFSAEIADVESSQYRVVSRFRAAQSVMAKFAYYGAPVLLVLSFVLHLRREKPIRSFGGQA